MNYERKILYTLGGSEVLKMNHLQTSLSAPWKGTEASTRQISKETKIAIAKWGSDSFVSYT